MDKQGFLGYDGSRQIARFYVNEKKTANFTFAPEIKSIEDMQVLSNYGLALDEGSPIMIRSNFWDYLMSSISIPPYKKTKQIKGLSPEILVNKHSFLFYEPPELFQFTYPKILITHAFGGNPLSSKNFRTNIKNISNKEKLPKVLEALPAFYIPFVEKQFHKYLLFDKKDEKLIKVANKIFTEKELEKRPNVSRGWNDERIDTSYPLHIAELLIEANKANKANNSVLIPPVPMIRRSTENSQIQLIKDLNITASTIRKALGKKFPHVYLHLYFDWKILDEKTSGVNAKSLLPLVEKTIEEGDFGGICLTIKGYQNAVEKSKFGCIESFVNDLNSIAQYYYLPIILPRSKWYGLKLFDYEINCFSSLLNGKTIYSKRTKGFKTKEELNGKKIDTHLEYGYTYIINKCVELNYDDTKKYIERNKGFPHVEYLPNVVNEKYWNDDRSFRIHVSKPRRLSHMEEARYIRKGRKNNVINPAKRYLERSKNPYFGTD